MKQRQTSQTMKPATAAKKLGVYLPATPTEFQEGVVSRAELAALQTDPPEWLQELRRGGPHPRRLGPAQELGRPRPFRPLVPAAQQGAPQGALAPPGQGEQPVLVDVAERAAQQGGQGQVVVGVEGEAGQGQEVLEGRMLGQHEPVGAGHRHAPPLAGAQQLLEQALALAHQDEEVAVAAGAPFPGLPVVHRLAALHH